VSWIKKVLGGDEEVPATAPENAADRASQEVVDGAVQTDASATEQRPDRKPEVAARGGTPEHSQILASLRRHLTKTTEKHGRSLGANELQDDVDMYEAGYLDSLMAAEFLVLAEGEFGVSLPDWLIGGQANTLETLAQYIAGELESN